ncbi:MAG: DMT family transporter [Deltaproteobacteria bacterium]|nr:DMT family transporter [Deltaproteobacteria bacterium]
MGELAALTAAFLWAVGSLLFARAGKRTAPVVLNLVKTAGGMLMTALTVLALGDPLFPTHLGASELSWLAVSGVLGLTVGDSAFFVALNHLGARKAMLLWAIVPLATALLAWPILDEIPGPMAAVGGVVTLAGVAWVLNERAPDGAPATTGVGVGLAFGLLAVACQAVGSVTAKMAGTQLDAVGLTLVRLYFGTAGLLIQVAVQGRLRETQVLLRDGRALLLVLTATALGTWLGLWLSMVALKLTLAAIAATLTATSPIFVLPLSRIFLKERLSVTAVVGAAVAVAGVAILVLR